MRQTEECKKRGVSIERNKAGTKKKSSDGLTMARANRPPGVAVLLLLLLLLLLKKVGSARLRESDVHPISPKTPSPKY